MIAPCTKCGTCCLHAYKVKELRDLGYITQDNKCKYLSDDGLCIKYESRPPICRHENGNFIRDVLSCFYMQNQRGDEIPQEKRIETAIEIKIKNAEI